MWIFQMGMEDIWEALYRTTKVTNLSIATPVGVMRLEGIYTEWVALRRLEQCWWD